MRIAAFALLCGFGLLFSRFGLTDGSTTSPKTNPTEFSVVLPKKIRPLPEGTLARGATPGFKFRGIKGWGWTPEQYLAEIPVMAQCKMNFLMNCYSSMWDPVEHGVRQRGTSYQPNHWYRPLAEAKKQAFEHVVRECQNHGIQFCFSMNPNLRSDRPFDYNDPRDMEVLWTNYAWMQGLGVRWFNVSLDDIKHRVDAAGQAKLLNEVLRRLRQKDPSAQLIFTPTWYAGPVANEGESNPRIGNGDTASVHYTKELAEKLNPEVFLFWTGPEECSLTITVEDAEAFRALSKHRIFIWDNYPVNDHFPTMHLGPLTGRDPHLATAVEGYISNPQSPQTEANRIPMLTIADYLWNPEAYDPTRSIGQSIAHLGRTREQRLVLKDLVELYPGRLVDGSHSTAWNSLRNRFRGILNEGTPGTAVNFIKLAEGVSRRMAKVFPDQFVHARQTLDADIAGMREEFAKKYPTYKVADFPEDLRDKKP